MLLVRLVILATFFLVSMAGAHTPTGKRYSSPANSEWKFTECRSWNKATDTVEDDVVSASIVDKPATFWNYRDISGSLRTGADHSKTITFRLPLDPGLPLMDKTTRFSQTSGGQSMVYEERGGEKIMVIPTKEAVRNYEPHFQKHQIAMFTASGKFVEAEIFINGTSFHYVRILRTCGGGFGYESRMNGEAILVGPANQKPSSGEIDPHRPTVTPVGRAYSRKESAMFQELLEREAQALTQPSK